MGKIKLPKSKISAVLLEKRLAQNKNQQQMAEDIGISYPTYREIEKGDYSISLKMLVKISNYLDINVSEAYEQYIK